MGRDISQCFSSVHVSLSCLQLGRQKEIVTAQLPCSMADKD